MAFKIIQLKAKRLVGDSFIFACKMEYNVCCMKDTYETTLEVDLKALAHNYNYLRDHLQEGVKFMGVVKGFAYGHDPEVIARKLSALGVNYLAVSYEEEGVALRKAGLQEPILIFHPQLENLKRLIYYRLIPSIYSKSTLRQFINLLTESKEYHYPIHLVMNTGMNRLGFEESEIDWVIQKLKETRTIRVEGIYSHFVASEDPKEKAFSLMQLTRFKEGSARISQNLNNKPLLHLCNTAGILNYPEAHLDMVRAGIGLYGFGNSAEADKNLQAVGSLKTVVSQIHHIKKGESVGYNRKFIAQRDSQIVILPLGYADGLHRHYGNGKTQVRINGHLAPIVGNVCMGIAFVDATGIDCEEGDEVLLFGKDKSAEAMARAAGTISYELIAGISKRVKRIFLD